MREQIKTLENHLQICRLGLLHAGRFHPHPRSEPMRGVPFLIYQAVHTTLSLLFEAGGLNQVAYDSTRAPSVKMENEQFLIERYWQKEGGFYCKDILPPGTRLCCTEDEAMLFERLKEQVVTVWNESPGFSSIGSAKP